MKKIMHVDLFSGIGGFSLAAERVWGKGNVEHIFCEINKYAQAVIRKQFGKDARIYGDIRGLTANANSNGLAGRGAEILSAESEEQALGDAQDRADAPRIHLLTGGFPCQPFSQAGKRKGTNDDRYLWPEMLRVIHEFKPTWVVAENVRGLLTISEGVVFEQVCADLEGEGYEVQPFVIPACAVNAPHRRDRVWIVANKSGSRQQEPKHERDTAYQTETRTRMDDRLERQDSDDTDTNAMRFQEQGAELQAGRDRPDDQDDTNASDERLEGREQERKGHGGLVGGERGDQRASWSQNWLEVATRFCGVDDGLPGALDGATLTKAGHRVERLKALGNAIVPQVAVEIMQAIRFAMSEENV